MAKLPNHSAAIIPDKKISGYLLSPTHPEGAPKAKFLESFGFSRANPSILTQALRAHAAAGTVVNRTATIYGTVYEVHGRIESPDGANPWLLVIWMVDEGADRPRLITAVPSEDRA
jgi:hypothetical protein